MLGNKGKSESQYYSTHHKSYFPLPDVDLGLQSFQCSKIRLAQHWGRRGAHLSENKCVKSECMKFGENSRQMAPVSTICDEYNYICRFDMFNLRMDFTNKTWTRLWGVGLLSTMEARDASSSSLRW